MFSCIFTPLKNLQNHFVKYRPFLKLSLSMCCFDGGRSAVKVLLFDIVEGLQLRMMKYENHSHNSIWIYSTTMGTHPERCCDSRSPFQASLFFSIIYIQVRTRVFTTSLASVSRQNCRFEELLPLLFCVENLKYNGKIIICFY